MQDDDPQLDVAAAFPASRRRTLERVAQPRRRCPARGLDAGRPRVNPDIGAEGVPCETWCRSSRGKASAQASSSKPSRQASTAAPGLTQALSLSRSRLNLCAQRVSRVRRVRPACARLSERGDERFHATRADARDPRAGLTPGVSAVPEAGPWPCRDRGVTQCPTRRGDILVTRERSALACTVRREVTP